MKKELNQKEVISKDLMTIPNAISFIRIILITPFVAFFVKDMYIPAAITIAISGLSDCFDGYIARKLHQESELGKILDPLADKLTLIAAGVCVIFLEPYVLPLMLLMVTKDVLMIIGGSIIIQKGIIPPKSSWYGKVSTVMFYISIGTVVLMAIFNFDFIKPLSLTLLGLTSLLMIYSLVNYIIIYFKLRSQFKNSDEKNESLKATVTDKGE